MSKTLFQISRLSLARPACMARCFHTQGTALWFQVTNILDGVPAKPKAKVDPQRQAAIEKRKRGRIEKMLKRLNKMARNLKPIEEIEGTVKLRKEIKEGLRERVTSPLSEEQLVEGILLNKEWCRQRFQLHLNELKIMNRVTRAQEKALTKLREESEELYQQAIQTDDALIPLSFKGPTITPPIKDYDSVDGEYSDITNYYNKPPKPML